MSELFLPKDYTSVDVPVQENNPDIIYLDLYKPKTVYYNMKAVFNGRQLDKDVPLKVQLGYGHRPLNLNNIADIRFNAAKPDGTGVQTIGEYKIFNPVAGLVYVNIPAATFSAPGILYFNLQVITNDNRVLSSNTCYFEVEASFTRAVFNAGNYDTEIEAAKKEALENIKKFNGDINQRLEDANAISKGIENSNHILAQAVDDNANAVRAGLAPTNGGANVFTGPNTFQEPLTTNDINTQNITAANDINAQNITAAKVTDPYMGRVVKYNVTCLNGAVAGDDLKVTVVYANAHYARAVLSGTITLPAMKGYQKLEVISVPQEAMAGGQVAVNRLSSQNNNQTLFWSFDEGDSGKIWVDRQDDGTTKPDTEYIEVGWIMTF